VKRVDTPELLDEHDAPRADMERSLRDLQRINRWLGGVPIYKRLLRYMLPRGERAVVVDLGAGTADQLDALDSNVIGIATDINLRHLLYRRERSRARRVVADAQQLPFRAGAVDVVTSAHFFHHFSPDENVTILSEALRVVRRGVAINDTRRHVVPLLTILLLSKLRLVGRITAADGPASVRRGYTVPEAREIGERSGAAKVEVVRLFPFRFGLLLWKNRST
jgi:ubiquinone/menaquinone biosynthesis C-methylase UbiE